MSTTTKRYKKVFSSHSEVAHIWAQRSQDEGRASRVFFEGDIIYSYGYHFKIARFQDVKNQTVVLFNSANYSPSTGKHQSRVSRAISQYETFSVPELGSKYGSEISHEVNVSHFEDKATAAMKKAVRARKNGEWLLAEAEGAINSMKRYAELFDVELTENQQDLISKVETDTLLSEEARQGIKDRLQAETKRIQEKNKEDIADWINGDGYSISQEVKQIYLRRKGDVVQTSYGANVPAPEARLLYHAIKKNLPVDGKPIGQYKVDEFNGKVLTVGCHRLDIKEIERFAKTQNW